MIIILGSAFFVSRAFVYDTNVAHPGLTRQAAELYQSQINTDHRLLTSQEIQWLMQGAIDEDYPFRWMNHFYDPVHNVGFKSSYDSAKTWAKNPANQANFSLGDWSWQRAIYEYQNGNRKEAFLALGHILHLLEDMTVPAHTRDDAHPEGDPYEQWVKNNFQAVSSQPIYFDSLEKYFDYLANYSNRNFYSKDTIAGVKYGEPNSTGAVEKDGYLYFKDGEIYKKLVGVSTDQISGIRNLYINDSVNSDYFSLLAPKAVGAGAGVIKLFFEEAAKEKVAAPTSLQTNLWGELQQPTGRVVQYLEETANSAKQIVSQPGSFASYVGFVSDLLNSGVALAKDLNDMPVVGAVASLSPETKLVSQAAQAILPAAAGTSAVLSPSSGADKVSPMNSKNSPASLPSTVSFGMTDSGNLTAQPALVSLVQSVPPLIESRSVVVSGGSAYSSTAPTPAASPSVSAESVSKPVESVIAPPAESASSSVESVPPSPPPPPPPPPPDTTPPEAPTILVPASSAFWTKSATTTVSGLVSLDTFQLTSNGIVEQVSSTAWSKIVDLNEGKNIFEFLAKDLAGNQSATATIKIYKDTMAPIALVNAQADLSNHLNLNVSWSANDGAGSGVASYDVEYKKQPLGSSSSTEWFGWQTATVLNNATFAGEEGNQYFFRVRAADKLGNVGEWVAATATIGWPRVVINEIAWAGTKAQANDEWLELYNASSTPVDLTGWNLTDGDDIKLTFATGSVIAAHGFYLLERTADTTVANIKADVIYTGSLKNSGEKLELRHRSGQLIDVVDFARGWPAGSTGQDPISMERIDPLAAGSSAANWQSTPGYVRNGYDAKGNSIYGTPKHPNSSLIYLNGVISTNRNLLAEDSPYFLGAVTVASGTTLTMESGTVILGGSGSRVNVYGKMKTEGTIEKPVVFTSLDDVNYKSDAVVSAPYWEYIKFFSGSLADLKNTRLLYGNNSSQGKTALGGVLQADGATVAAENLEISFSSTSTDYRLASFVNSTSTISGSKFSGGLGGLYFSSGAATIQNTQVENLGLWALEADSLNSLILENNTFKNNGWVYSARPLWQQPQPLPPPVLVKNFIPQAKNNVFVNNTINALALTGQINNSGAIDNAGDWPWVSGGLTITASGTLEIKPGSKLKMLAGSIITVNGVLNISGVDGQPVSITSYHDDSDGMDVDLLNNQTASQGGGEWKQIIFESAATSTLNYLNVSFANGTPRDANSAGSIFINSTPMTANNLIVRYSRPPSAALQLKNSNATVAGGLFKNETKIPFDPSSSGYGVGIIVDGGAPTLSSLTIDTFTYGLIKKNKPLVELNNVNFINVDKETIAW